MVETISGGRKNSLDWMSFKHHSSVIIYQIDLHGYTFEEAESKLENWLIEEYNKHNFPIEVVTGNSKKMKKVVYKVCEKLEFKAMDSFDGNPGLLIIRE